MKDLEVPDEDPEALEKALKAHKESQTIRKRKPAKVPDSATDSITPMEAKCPVVVGLTIEDSEPAGEKSKTPPENTHGIEGGLGTQGDQESRKEDVTGRGTGEGSKSQ